MVCHWLTTVRCAHPAQQIVLQDYIQALQNAEARLDRLTRRIEGVAAKLDDGAGGHRAAGDARGRPGGRGHRGGRCRRLSTLRQCPAS